MSELHAKKPRFIFQDIVATCGGCRRDDVSVISSDLEPGLFLAKHLRPYPDRGLCGGGAARPYEAPKPDKKPKKTGTHGR